MITFLLRKSWIETFLQTCSRIFFSTGRKNTSQDDYLFPTVEIGSIHNPPFSYFRASFNLPHKEKKNKEREKELAIMTAFAAGGGGAGGWSQLQRKQEERGLFFIFFFYGATAQWCSCTSSL
jgi:hypothetical protein